MIDNLKKEIEILLLYLPEQLSEEEIEKIVKEVISETGAATMRDMGTVMKAASEKTKGKADGKVVSDIVKKLLS